MKSGKSAGERDVTRLPSTTTDWSIQIAPAFYMSSLMVLVLVSVRPLTIPALMPTHPA